MLAPPDPVPTGLITALLGRARALPSAITSAIGPSPRLRHRPTPWRDRPLRRPCLGPREPLASPIPRTSWRHVAPRGR